MPTILTDKLINSLKTLNGLYTSQGSDEQYGLGDLLTDVYKASGGADISALTGDVTATGPGSVPGTVVFVGGQAASNIAAITASLRTPSVQARYVSKSGNDSTGNGSLGLPFLTVAAAQASVLDASTANQYTMYIGPGTFSEVNTFTLLPNWRYVGSGKRNATALKLANSTPIPGTFPSGAQNAIGLDNLIIFNGLTLSQTAGSAAGGTFRAQNTTFLGTNTLTGGGNDSVSSGKAIKLDIWNCDASSGSFIFNAASGIINSTKFSNVTFGNTSVDGFIGGLSPGMFACDMFGLTINGITAPTGSGTIAPILEYCNISLITLNGLYSGVTNLSSAVAPVSTVTGTINGTTLVTGLSSVPATGTPFMGRGIPDNTIVTGSPSAGQATLSNAATQTAAGRTFYTRGLLKFLTGALASQYASSPAEGWGYSPNTSADWPSLPQTTGQALDYLANGRVASLAPVDSTPNANGASISGQVLTLQPADATNPGLVTALAQNIGGAKTFLDKLTIDSSGADFNNLHLKSQGFNVNPSILITDDVGEETFRVNTPGFATARFGTVALPMQLAVDNLASALNIDGLNPGVAIFSVAAQTLNDVVAGPIIAWTSAGATVTGSIAASNISTAAEQSLGALTWTGAVDPSGTISKTYRWSRNGNTITAWFKITATVAGTANTEVSFALPGDMPNPSMWASQPNATAVAIGSGALASGTDPSGVVGTCTLSKDGGGAFIVEISDTAVATTFVMASISYLI